MEIVITIIICVTVITCVVLCGSGEFTINLVHTYRDGASVHDNMNPESLKEEEEALEKYYKENDVPTFDNIVAAINETLRGEDIDER